MVDIGILILRCGLGVMFFAHGLQLAWGKFGGPGIEGFSKMLGGLGFNSPLLWAYLGGYTTLLGGLLLILGVFTRRASLFLLIFISVATVKVHLSKGFFITNGGYEYNFIIAICCLTLIIMGSGKYSLLNKF